MVTAFWEMLQQSGIGTCVEAVHMQLVLPWVEQFHFFSGRWSKRCGKSEDWRLENKKTTPSTDEQDSPSVGHIRPLPSTPRKVPHAAPLDQIEHPSEEIWLFNLWPWQEFVKSLFLFSFFFFFGCKVTGSVFIKCFGAFPPFFCKQYYHFLKIFLFWERERDRERNWSFICWFMPQMT